ncbi:hypothetical protein AB0323_02900 [Arthrobacter sp. NPDC080031]|uniref:hypothetical protein n=1 Tax=Arthrobacter sp. NPDC080031 TaxID=3155918 RepID=UPI00344DD41B
MSSRLTNSVRTPFKALRSRFPYLGTDFLKILIAIGCGIGFASLFTWGSTSDMTSISAPGIFLRNASLAVLALFLTHYGAIVMMILNGVWLGMGLGASTAAIGLHQTVALTAVHIPLEIVAWALTIQGARLFWPALLGIISGEDNWRHVVQRTREVLIAAATFSFLAALAEWAEHALLER